MAINLLKNSEFYNIEYPVGLPHKELSRQELFSLASISGGSFSVDSLSYFGFQANLKTPFYCKDFTLLHEEAPVVGYAFIRRDSYHEWKSVPVEVNTGKVYVNFNLTKPDHAQLVYQFKFILANVHTSAIDIYGAELLSVDYPIGFDYSEFSLVATSRANLPISVRNNCIQKTSQDIRVLPIFSDDYQQDSVYMLTESGKEDSEKYNIQRGFRFPEDAGWERGRISEWYDDSQGEIVSTMMESDRGLVVSGTAPSGVWTSPVIYLPDEDMISMYVYTENMGDSGYLGDDYRKISQLVEVRGSDVSPEPNFLINSWTQRLLTIDNQRFDYQKSIALPARRLSYISAQTIPDSKDAFWTANREICPHGIKESRPYILGRSKRMYVRGDGEVLASSPEKDDGEGWEFAHRGYQEGIPFREFGDINSYWNAGQVISLMGNFSTTYCESSFASDTKWFHQVVASESDSSDWEEGKFIGGKLIGVYPLVYHFAYDRGSMFGLGLRNEEVSFTTLGSITMAVDSHPNEWINIVGILYPWAGTERYMCLYYTHTRNYWPYESKLLGIYGVGETPCEEGWAVCKCKLTGGFWLHVGYMHRFITKYSLDGDEVATNRVNYGFSSLVQTTDPKGLWAIRNDAIYWYSENNNGELTEEFSITYSGFKFLQAGEVDENNNLWLVDRDTSIVYRINFGSRSIDYEKTIPYTVAVWPHPRDGTAYLYSSFNAGTFSTAVKKIEVDDPYGYVSTVMALPELPISDYSGVQFMGRSVKSYMRPSINDPIWGTNDDITLDWQVYPNASLTLPKGRYKQVRVTLNRSDLSSEPVLSKIRIPKSMVLSQLPYGEEREIYINPHLRYNKQHGYFNTNLVVWWPH